MTKVSAKKVKKVNNKPKKIYKKPKLSTVFWKAANLYLAEKYDCTYPTEFNPNKYIYSCEAVGKALDEYSNEILYHPKSNISSLAFSLIEELGCDSGSAHEFTNISVEKRQAARYNWLMFLYLYCKENNI